MLVNNAGALWSEAWWENAKPEVRAHRCKAHRKNGDRCKRAAIDGANECPQHGGRAPQVRAKAQRRLAEATDTMARALLKMATDDNVSDSVKLTAIRDALDRGGVGAKTQVDVGISVTPFEAILDSLESGSRSAYRRSVGREDDSDESQLALVDCLRADDDDDAIVEGEVLDDDDDDDDDDD